MLYEHGMKKWENSEIQAFDPERDVIAQPIKVDNYIMRDNFGPIIKPMKKFKEAEPTDQASSQDIFVFDLLAENHKVENFRNLITNFSLDMAARHFEQVQLLFKRFGKLKYGDLIKDNFL